MTQPQHVYTLYIRTSPEQLWSAITDPQQTEKFFFGFKVATDWQPGSPIEYRNNGALNIDGEVIEVDPPRKLVHTFHGNNEKELGDKPSRVTWEITPQGELVLLTLVHDDFDGETATFRGTGEGWPMVLSSLKSYLETGVGLTIRP